MTLKGIVQEIIYRNVDNGYTVLSINSNDFLFTAVGIVPPVSEGELLVLEGEVKQNNKFGEQFVIESVKITPPSTKENIIRYLSSGLFKGLGPVSASSIVAHFGEQTLSIIENSPEQLATIKGISIKKAIEIGNAFIENKAMQDTILNLSQYDISVNLAIKIYKQYHNTTNSVLATNPYRVIDDITGIGFFTADKIAKKMNISEDSPFRIRASLVYVLKENAMKNGNTLINKETLIGESLKLLATNTLDSSHIQLVIDDMLSTFEIIEIKNIEYFQPMYMLTMYYNMEKTIAKHIVRFNKTPNKFKLNIQLISDLLSLYEKVNKITLHESQKQAVVTALMSGATIITGGPGTGKTTIIKAIIYIIKQINASFMLCAPTGRAAKRMSEATGETAKTIHRLLDLNYKGKEFASCFTYNEDTTLPTDILIVDEVSMCDEYVFSSLIKAIPKGAKMIIVGDADQLPSVGAGNVFHDLIASGELPLVRLTQIYRQDEKSLIITNSHRINEGEMPIIDNTSRDFYFIEKNNAEDNLNEVISLCLNRLPDFANVSSKDIQVLCPMKKGINGVININNELQKNLNPQNYLKKEIKTNENIFRIGDKVIHTVNNYQLEWTRLNHTPNGYDLESGVGIYNGDIGYITNVDKASMKMTVTFEDNRSAEYSADCFDQLQLAYAISIHKSQGSEFPVVIISLCSGSNMLLTKNLLYTAVTRAKNLVVIVGEKYVMKRMITNNYCKKRFTYLKELIIEESTF